ncbi:MAG TPA: co-chaperone GroES [Gemmatimonadales bacterium]|nr:co-chaperone GroES [Gemmatimonadales bacterium]
MKLRPLGDRVLVRPDDSDKPLPSGLVIPDTAKEKPQEGVILAVGPGAYHEGTRIPLDVKEGDRIVYSKYGGTEVAVEGEDLLILAERDILAVVG